MLLLVVEEDMLRTLRFKIVLSKFMGHYVQHQFDQVLRELLLLIPMVYQLNIYWLHVVFFSIISFISHLTILLKLVILQRYSESYYCPDCVAINTFYRIRNQLRLHEIFAKPTCIYAIESYLCLNSFLCDCELLLYTVSFKCLKEKPSTVRHPLILTSY